jgi:MFS family permease
VTSAAGIGTGAAGAGRGGRGSADPRIARYRWLVGGYSVSSYGSFLDTIALNLFVYTLTRSALAMGLFMVVRLAAGLVAGLKTGDLVVRYSHKQVMVWTNVVQAAALALLLLAPKSLRTEALFLLALLSGAASTLFMAAFRSVVVDLVGQDRRNWANSLMVIGRSMAMVGGFASAGLLVALAGYRAAFTVDLATFVVCAIVTAIVRFPAAEPVPADLELADPELAAVLADGAAAGGQPSRWRLSSWRTPGRRGRAGRPASGSRAAATALRATPALVLMLWLRGVDGFDSASHNAALPVYSTALDPHDAAGFVSKVWLFWAVGNIVVQQLMRWWSKRTGQSIGARGFGIGTLLMSVSFIAIFVGFPVPVTLAIAVLAGMADGMTEVAYNSHLQTLPDRVRTHAFGISATVENTGLGSGMVITGALLEWFSPLSVVGVAHGVAIVLAIVFLIRLATRHGTRHGGAAGERPAADRTAGEAAAADGESAADGEEGNGDGSRQRSASGDNRDGVPVAGS